MKKTCFSQIPAWIKWTTLTVLSVSMTACTVGIQVVANSTGKPNLAAVATALTLSTGQSVIPIVFPNSGANPDNDGCRITPDLPAGLMLGISSDGSSCAITGMPIMEMGSAIYTVTASNASGGSSATINLAVAAAIVVEISSLSSSNKHSCTIDSEGRLMCWGDGQLGQLGNRLIGENLSTPTQIGVLRNWAAVSTGSSHTCAINTDAQLYCWGAGQFGRLGLGTDNLQTQPSPARVGASINWAQVSAGGEHTCAISNTRALYCWGNNVIGQLGTGLASAPQPPEQGANNQLHVPTQVGSATNWMQVGAGATHTCAVNEGGQLYCWGNGANGILGNANTDDQAIPVRVGSDADWARVSAGVTHTCALNQGGEIFCWGTGFNGQLGNSDTATQDRPVPAGTASNWVSVVVGSSHTCALNQDGEIFCWGEGQNGQLGNNQTTDRSAPTQVGQRNDWSLISAGARHSCAADSMGESYCWGSGDDYRLGNASTSQVNQPALTRMPDTWLSYTTGLTHTCAINQNAQLYCWGGNADGQLGLGNSQNALRPTRVGAAANWTAVSAGGAHTCALAGGSAWCWGENNQGQLGNASFQKSLVPVAVGVASDWNSIAAGAEHSCAIRGGEDLYCWGRNGGGRLGVSSSGNINEPAQIANTRRWDQVSVAISSSCAIEKSGALYCWGSRYLDATVTATPTRIGILNWLQVSLGGDHFCALLSNNSLRCAGEANFGQLGIGSFSSQDELSAEVIIAEGRIWNMVSSGENHTCAITNASERSERSLYCWGQGLFGQTGLGVNTDANHPSAVKADTAWNSVQAGGQHTCALSADNQLWCWGQGSSGQLGNGAIEHQNTPVLVDAP